MKTTFLISFLLFTGIVSYAQGGTPSATFPTLNVRMETTPVYNSDSSSSTIETIILIAMSDTVDMNRVHVQLKNRGTNQLQQQQAVTISPSDLWEKFSGNGTREAYEIAVKLSGDHTQEKLEVELENRSGNRSQKFIIP